jgi:hypothetical protein
METSNVDTQPKEEAWSDYDNSDNEDEGPVEEKKEVVKEPKKQLQKDKTGEIIISKLEAYVEPTKTVKEARGDTRMRNNYDFGDISFDESESEGEHQKNDSIEEKEEESEEENDNKRKKKQTHKKEEDLDELLKEFGIEAKKEEKKESKPKVKKEKRPKPEGTESKEGNTEETKTEDTKTETKKPKKKKTADKTKKTSHVAELKREIIERKEALKKKEKKKGL